MYLCGAILLCVHSVRKTSVSIEAYQLVSFRMRICAFHPETSSFFFRKEFPLFIPIFVLSVLQ